MYNAKKPNTSPKPLNRIASFTMASGRVCRMVQINGVWTNTDNIRTSQLIKNA